MGFGSAASGVPGHGGSQGICGDTTVRPLTGGGDKLWYEYFATFKMKRVFMDSEESPWDLYKRGAIGTSDILILLANWGPCG